MINYLNFVKEFLIKNRNYIFFSFLFFLFCIFLFIIIPLSQEEINLILETFKKEIENIPNTNLKNFAYIFVNNLIIALILFLSGFLFSIFSIFITLKNVFTIWVIINFNIQKYLLLTSILAILPHWIIEISAMLLSLALWFKITYLIIKKIWNWKKHKILLEVIDSFIFFLDFIVPLIFIAAFIEAFISPLFLK